MLATLAAVTLLLFRDILNLGYRPHTEPSMLVLAAACGLFIAPFLTLVCRSTLAAAVFTIAIPGLLAAGADIVGGLLYGLHNAAAIDRFKLAVFWRGMFLICAVSAVAGWWMFTRLEVIEGHARRPASGPPAARPGDGPRPRAPAAPSHRGARRERPAAAADGVRGRRASTSSLGGVRVGGQPGDRASRRVF